MAFVEFLRVRNAFVIYAGITAAVILTLVLSLHGSPPVIVGDAGPHAAPGALTVTAGGGGPAVSGKNLAIPLGVLLGIAGYCAMIFATAICTSLNYHNRLLGFIFTKPVSRVRIAATFIGVDAITIVVAFVFALFVVTFTPLASAGLLRYVFVDREALALGLLGLGIAFMWYGLLQAATSWYKGGGGRICGLSWALFFVLIIVSHAPIGALGHGLVSALNYLNPLAYLTEFTVGDGGRTSAVSLIPVAASWRALLVWLIALAGCAVAVFAWKRQEA